MLIAVTLISLIASCRSLPVPLSSSGSYGAQPQNSAMDEVNSMIPPSVADMLYNSLPPQFRNLVAVSNREILGTSSGSYAPLPGSSAGVGMNYGPGIDAGSPLTSSVSNQSNRPGYHGNTSPYRGVASQFASNLINSMQMPVYL